MNRFKLSFFTVLCVMAYEVSLFSCSDTDEDYVNNEISNEKDVVQMINSVSTQWGISQQQIISYMKGYIRDSTNTSDILSFTNNRRTRYISYEFVSDSLRCALLLWPKGQEEIRISDAIKSYDYVGILGSSDVYVNEPINTMAFVDEVKYDTITYISIGFAPIRFELFETLNPIEVLTGDAVSISYNSATVNGEISGITSKASVGIYYDTDPSLPESTRKVKTTTSTGSFALSLTNLKVNTTYYYQAYAIIDNITYRGDIKQFNTDNVTVYSIGDLYPDTSKPEGVVFYITNSGVNGKIVSLDHASLYWDTETLFASKRGCGNTSDGSVNTPKMPSSSERMLAGPWCTNHGDGWYCPARGELVTLANSIKKVNATLETFGYSPLSGYFWSSTEYSNNSAYEVCLVPWNSTSSSGSYSAVGKGQSYAVCAIKKF